MGAVNAGGRGATINAEAVFDGNPTCGLRVDGSAADGRALAWGRLSFDAFRGRAARPGQARTSTPIAAVQTSTCTTTAPPHSR
jgi:hypothetical protein